jgi:hypothetical protein
LFGKAALTHGRSNLINRPKKENKLMAEDSDDKKPHEEKVKPPRPGDDDDDQNGDGNGQGGGDEDATWGTGGG